MLVPKKKELKMTFLLTLDDVETLFDHVMDRVERNWLKQQQLKGNELMLANLLFFMKC